MAENETRWLYEAGIGENRALLIECGRAAQIRIERPDGARLGEVLAVKLARMVGRGRAVGIDEAGREYLVERIAPGATEGARIQVEIRREAGLERGRFKSPVARPTEAAPGRGASLLERIEADGLPVERGHAAGPDRLAEHGWHELIEAAQSGHWSFEGGSLRIDLTAAMTLIDVDGEGAPRDLALAAAPEAARVIRLFGLSGNIGIDFPTLEARADRTRLMQAFDDAMAAPCERTAPNGFGFMQVVTRRSRASLPEILARSPVRAAMLAMLRQAERARGTGALTLRCHPAVAAKLEREAALIETLGRSLGRPVVVEPRALGGLAIFDLVQQDERHG